MQRRMMIAATPIVIVATLLVSEISAQAILPVKKSKFYVGPLIALSARGIPTSSAATNFTVPSLACGSGTSAVTGITFGSGIYSARKQLGLGGGRGSRVPSRSSGLQRRKSSSTTR